MFNKKGLARVPLWGKILQAVRCSGRCGVLGAYTCFLVTYTTCVFKRADLPYPVTTAIPGFVTGLTCAKLSGEASKTSIYLGLVCALAWTLVDKSGAGSKQIT
eukprot:Platyproteum_vivax@DN6884_c0_g1_i1.p1